jgi:hypothetical protein
MPYDAQRTKSTRVRRNDEQLKYFSLAQKKYGKTNYVNNAMVTAKGKTINDNYV